MEFLVLLPIEINRLKAPPNSKKCVLKSCSKDNFIANSKTNNCSDVLHFGWYQNDPAQLWWYQSNPGQVVFLDSAKTLKISGITVNWNKQVESNTKSRNVYWKNIIVKRIISLTTARPINVLMHYISDETKAILCYL